MANKKFQDLVDRGNQVGEVVAVDRFLVRVRGLQPINTHALIMFDDGSKGYVHHVFETYVVVLHMGPKSLPVGTIAVLQHHKLVARVGKNYVGRVISVLGEPLDGKGPIVPDGTWPIFHNAPMLFERELLDKPLETGIITLDILFSIVRGQRMALLGDGKSGKSSLATQIAINQRSTDIITIYVLIGKRRADLIELIDRLEKNGAMEKTIIIASNMFESLVLNYLAPYVAAAMGEYFWQELAQDTLVIYDDLTSHAMAYREISLIAGVSPGRDSYPGDMFYVHSQLVERAGKLGSNHATQTIIPIVYAPSGDITAYLPTNVMSMTDGQWILDMAVFKEIMRPAVSTGMSVTRVGGVGQNKRQKALAGATSKALSAYRQAEEYAHFGSELSAESTAALRKGKNLYALFNQIIGETYSLVDQQFLLDIIHGLTAEETIDIDGLKKAVAEYSARLQNDDTDESNFDALRDELKSRFLVQHAEETAKPEDAPKSEEKSVEPTEKGKKSKKKGDKDKGKDDKTEQPEKLEKPAAPEVIVPAAADEASKNPSPESDEKADDKPEDTKDDKKEEPGK